MRKQLNAKKIAGIIILAPFFLPLAVFLLVACIPIAIIGFPMLLGLSLVTDESLLEFYRFYFTEFAIFPFKIWFGISPY